ncbi:MAG: lactate utilization protein [Desulfuromonadales bacterium]|nr:lactate utilization protein [Desulfuromonadales bacterium]NIR34397.1 lactate utilization protein [Desulfuromonadales bacterium]NIS42948.1 lactate utilization protein [Desulfuromonadales bacterium]
MADNHTVELFIEKARLAGASVRECPDLSVAVDYVCSVTDGPLALPAFSSAEHHDLTAKLQGSGCRTLTDILPSTVEQAAAGITGANFAIAETGTVVLESTAEDIRLASTLPPIHFVLLDRRKIIVDSLEANPLLRRFHQRQPTNYLAYITGPSRTADIERVLTIGVHGPKELHILLIDGYSDDPLEM